jgi:hypothetical protein
MWFPQRGGQGSFLMQRTYSKKIISHTSSPFAFLLCGIHKSAFHDMQQGQARRRVSTGQEEEEGSRLSTASETPGKAKHVMLAVQNDVGRS